MKYLGIDFGSKRVGVAVSDETGKMAFPYSVILNSEKLLEEVEKIIDREKIDEIIIGESKNFEGNPNKIMADIKIFKEKLEDLPAQSGKTKLKIYFEPEFMTSQQAEQIQHRRRGSVSRPQRR